MGLPQSPNCSITQEALVVATPGANRPPHQCVTLQARAGGVAACSGSTIGALLLPGKPSAVPGGQ